MKIVCMSDTHWQLAYVKNVPDGDVLIHAGDFLGRGTHIELINFNNWLGEQPHKHKIVVAGNHDWVCEQDPSLAAQTLSNAKYLCDSAVEIDGVLFYGTPYQPAYYDWAFNLPRGSEELKAKWARIPDETNVLITHTPPHGILDRANDQIKTGDKDLLRRIVELTDLRLHAFGHIHESYGIYSDHGLTFVNAAVCDIKYEPVNKIQVVEI